MKSGTTAKLKFKKMTRKLGLPLWQGVGLLESLWTVTASEAPRGNIGVLSNEDIAALIEWSGDADAMVEALVETRWLDRHETHRLVVHDWHDHAPNYVKGNIRKHGHDFASISPKERNTPPKKSPKEKNRRAKSLPRRGESRGSDPPTKSSQVKSSQVKPPVGDAGGAGGNGAPTQQDVFGALAEACGVDIASMTAGERGRLGTAATQIHGTGAGPDDVKLRARRHKRVWPTMDLTPTSLAKHWSRFAEDPDACPVADAIGAIESGKKMQ